MTKRKIGVRHKRSRVILSELLPYEVPVTFSNANLYKFLNATNIRFNQSEVLFDATDSSTKTILKIIFGKDVQITDRVGVGTRSYAIARKQLERPTVPFQYEIRHKEKQSRRLSVAHPMSQISFIDLYEEHKASLLYHTSRSPYSVRHPSRVTRYTVIRDGVFDELLTTQPGLVETTTQEYDRIRSFFVYKQYDNVHKFYESAEYRDGEKQFGHLLRLDITKCFDSIYTHSIAWAIFDKESVKRDKKAHETTFADQFDRAIRRLNDNETHGILIGPEISRIFAEIVLQRVDREVEFRLRKEGIIHGTDYRVMRYVDDYFIFLRDPSARDRIVDELEAQLRPYRFHLNDSKEAVHSTPFISDMSIAKDRLRRGLSKNLRLDVAEDGSAPELVSVEFSSSAARMIALYKTVLRETNLGPLDVVNFTLADVEIQLESLMRSYVTCRDGVDQILDPTRRDELRVSHQRTIMKALVAAVELTFFVYGGSPRVAPAIKLARIVALSRKFVKEVQLSKDAEDTLDDLIFHETIVQLRRNPLTQYASVENLYLLTILSELGEHYLVEVDDLCEFVGIRKTNRGPFEVPGWFNVFIVFELFRFMADHAVYSDLKLALERWVVARIEALDASERQTAEQPIYVLNAIVSPHLSRIAKNRILALYKVAGKPAVAAMEHQDEWFSGWKGLDLHAELLMKRVQEVY